MSEDAVPNPSSLMPSTREVRFTGVVHQGLSVGVFEVALLLGGLCLGTAAFTQPASHQLPLFFVAALTAFWITMKSFRRAEPTRGEFVFKDGALWSDGGAFISGVPQGVFWCLSNHRAPHTTLLLVENRKPLLEIVVRTETEARDLAKRLGLTDGAIVTGDEKPAGAKFAATAGISLVLAIMVFPALSSTAPGLTMLALTVGVLLLVCLVASQYTSARIGADGIYVRGSLENRFIPFAQLHGVSEFGPWVRLHVEARDVFISTPSLPWSRHRDAARKALVEQIAARLSRYREAAVPSERTTITEGSYRLVETTLQDLATLAESPGAKPELRVEAARVIRSGKGLSIWSDEDWRAVAPRLRVAANDSASPTLSKALALAAEDHEGVDEPPLTRKSSGGCA